MELTDRCFSLSKFYAKALIGEGSIKSTPYRAHFKLLRAKQGAPGCERRQKRRQKPPKTAAKVPGHRVTAVNFPIFPSVSNLSNIKTVKEGAELLLKKRWWNRIWVVQETLLAKEATVVLGSWVLPWDIFVSAAVNFYSHIRSPCCSKVLDFGLPELQRLFHGAIWTIAGTLSYAVERPPPEDELLYLLWAFRFKQATDDRDKVFGVLSLNKSASLRHGIVPNYSLSTLQLYLQVVEKHIEATSTLHSIVNWRPRRAGVPTWLPD